MTLICCEFTPRQLDVIQSVLTQAASRGDGKRDEAIMDAWEAVRQNRAYGGLKKAPSAAVAAMGAYEGRLG